MNATLEAVCAVHAIKPDAGRVGRTAIDKRPVDGALRVEPLGLVNDNVCDTKDHGGIKKALYAYAREEAERWAEELGRDVPPGLLGENLAIRGLDVTDAVVGERWRIGDTVEVAVTEPRVPCATFTRHMDNEPRWVRRFTERGDVGAYLEVLVPGVVRAGDPITVLFRPEGAPTVREVFRSQFPVR